MKPIRFEPSARELRNVADTERLMAPTTTDEDRANAAAHAAVGDLEFAAWLDPETYS